MTGLALTTCVLLASTLSAGGPAREELNLGGEWQYQRVAELGSPPNVGVWQTMQVPGTLRGYDYERVWFRRSFTLPETMKGKRIKIRFDGVKYNSRIFVNGRHVAGASTATMPSKSMPRTPSGSIGPTH